LLFFGSTVQTIKKQNLICLPFFTQIYTSMSLKTLTGVLFIIIIESHASFHQGTQWWFNKFDCCGKEIFTIASSHDEFLKVILLFRCFAQLLSTMKESLLGLLLGQAQTILRSADMMVDICIFLSFPLKIPRTQSKKSLVSLPFFCTSFDRIGSIYRWLQHSNMHFCQEKWLLVTFLYRFSCLNSTDHIKLKGKFFFCFFSKTYTLNDDNLKVWQVYYLPSSRAMHHLVKGHQLITVEMKVYSSLWYLILGGKSQDLESMFQKYKISVSGFCFSSITKIESLNV